MTYKKPDDITYTQMAIYIDENIYTDYFDTELVYQYLYHLVYMLSTKAGYYSRVCDYDEFSLFSATKLFLRLTNKKQFELDTCGEYKLKRIKSILNYIKKVIYPYKVDFDSETSNILTKESVIQTDIFELSDVFLEQESPFDSISFSLSLSSVANIVKAHLSKLPKKKNSSEWNNIYISCMLTLLDSITPSKKQLDHIRSLKFLKAEDINNMYLELRYEQPILFHLPSSMSNYIQVLVNEIRHVLAAEIGYREHSYISSDAAMKTLIYTSIHSEKNT